MTVLLSGPARDLSVHSFHFRDTTGHAAVDAMTAGGWQRLLISAAASGFRVDDSCPLAVLISLFSPDMLVSSPPVQRPLSARAPCLAVGSSGGRLRVRGLRRTRSPHNIARVEGFFFFFFRGSRGPPLRGFDSTSRQLVRKVRRGRLQRRPRRD